MIHKITILLVTFLIAESVYALPAKDSIQVVKSFWGNSYFMNGKQYSRGDIIDTLEANPFTQVMVSSSSTTKTWGYIILGAGVFMSLYAYSDIYVSYTSYRSFPTSLRFNKVFALAVALDLIGIVTLLDGKIVNNKTISAYNKNLSTTSQNNDINVKLNLGLNRLTLTVDF